MMQKEKDSSFSEECTVIMLSTEKENKPLHLGVLKALETYDDGSENGIIEGNIYLNKNAEITPEITPVYNAFQPQHLYLLSNQVPGIGDYYILNDTVCKVDESTFSPESYCKIIATTNRSLNIPPLSSDFVKKYCEQGGFDKVLISFIEYKRYKNLISGAGYKDPFENYDIWYSLHMVSDNTEIARIYK